MADIRDQRCITLDGATRALTASLKHAASIEVPVCVAVVDTGSNLVSFPTYGWRAVDVGATRAGQGLLGDCLQGLGDPRMVESHPR